MRNDLVKIYGKEYDRKQMYSNSTLIPGKTIQIKESMVYRFSKGKSYSGNAGITVATFVTTIIGIKYTWVSNIAILLDITGSVLKKKETVQEHKCTVNIYRIATVNNSIYAYTIADKFINYRGFEDKYGYGRAFVATDKSDVSYAPSSSYYSNYLTQAKDAKDMYNKIGQKP